MLRYYTLDLHDLGTDRFTWRRLGALIRYLPREASTVQEILGDEARWSDNEHLLALVVDSVAYLGWMFAGVHAKNAPKRPPDPVRRPGDVSTVAGMTLTRNLSEHTEISATSMTFAELEAAIERQTGVAGGVAKEV